MDGFTPYLTYLLIGVTVAISYRGFQNPATTSRLMFDTELILRRRQVYRLLSSALVHAGWPHLIFNMVALYLFGEITEWVLGPVRYLALYVISILGGSLLALWIHRGEPYRALGASGGVSGIMFGCIALFPCMQMRPLLLPVALPAWLWGLLFMGASVYGMKRRADNIGHDAHLGGAITGLVTTVVLVPQVVTRSPVFVALAVVAVLLATSTFGVGWLGAPWRSRPRRTPPSPRGRIVRLPSLEERRRKSRGDRRTPPGSGGTDGEGD